MLGSSAADSRGLGFEARTKMALPEGISISVASHEIHTSKHRKNAANDHLAGVAQKTPHLQRVRGQAGRTPTRVKIFPIARPQRT